MSEYMQAPDRSPVEQFVHEAKVLPYFDLGDELQDFRVVYGDGTAEAAEAAYQESKEAK
ncbi:MAG TPA: hypothetical protein VFL85_01880 [Candidatus Saccharimonadales bacterium]|nr:hypothetical protein [Candidatus Saccharimonadales bacterium]